MSSRSSSATALAALAALGLGACAEGEQDAVKQTLLAYHRYLGAGDGKRACELVAADYKRLAVEEASLIDPGVSTCEELVETVASSMDERERLARTNARIRRVRIDKDRATILPQDIEWPADLVTDDELSDDPVVLVKQNGAWKVAS